MNKNNESIISSYKKDKEFPENIINKENLKQNIIEQETEKKEKVLSNREVYTFMLFWIFFMCVLFTQIDTNAGYNINVAINSGLDRQGENLDNIYGPSNFYNWFNSLLEYIDSEGSYDYNGNDYLAFQNYNLVYSAIRLTQRRSTTVPNPASSFQKLAPTRWSSSGIMPNDDFSKNEDTSTYGTGTNFTYQVAGSYKDIGGYVQTLVALNPNMHEIIKNVTSWQDGQWIDSLTSSIMIDFVIFNPLYGQYCYVEITFIFKNSGLIDVSVNYNNIRRTLYSTSLEIARAVAEIIYMLLFLFYLIVEVLEVYDAIDSENKKLSGLHRKNELKKSKSKSKKHKTEVLDKGVSFITMKGRSVYLGLQKYLGDVWNIIDICSIVLSLTCICLWCRFIFKHALLNSSNIQADASTNKIFAEISLDFITYQRIASFNLILFFLKALRYLAVWFKRVLIIFRTLSAAASDIFHFLIMLLFIFISFVLMCNLYFGDQITAVTTVGDSFITLFTFIMADLDTELLMFNINPSLTFIIILIFMIAVQFILVNLFIAFLARAYITVNKREKEEEEEKKKSLAAERIKGHILWRAQNFIKKIWYKVKDKKRKIRRHDSEDTPKKDELEKNINLAMSNSANVWDKDIHNEENISDPASINKIPAFLTEKEELFQKAMAEKECGKVLWAAICFIFFAILYIAVLLNELDIETTFKLNSTAVIAIESIPIDSTYTTWTEDISTYDDMKSWLTYGFINFTQSSTQSATLTQNNGLDNITTYVEQTVGYYIFQSNYLLGDKFRVTFRKGLNISGSLDGDNYINLYKVSDPLNIPSSYDGYEKTDSFNGTSGKTYNYTQNGAYQNEAGYVTYLNANQSTLPGDLAAIIEDQIISPDLWLFVIDYVTLEASTGYYTYVAIQFVFPQNGMIRTNFIAYTIDINKYATNGDKVRLAFEVVYVLCLIYYIGIYIYGVSTRNKKYSEWYDAKIKSVLSEIEKAQRQKKNPEYLRRLSYLFNVFHLFEAVLFIFSIINIILWIKYVVETSNLEATLPIQTTDFYNQFYNTCKDWRLYTDLCLVSTICLSVKILDFMDKSEDMGLLTATLIYAKKDILYFIAILVFMLLGFVGMAYINFGFYLNDFSDFGSAMIDFSFQDLSNTNPVMAIVFFLPFMILFVFILLNIFLAIINQSYGEVVKQKQRTISSAPKMSIKNILFYCFLHPENPHASTAANPNNLEKKKLEKQENQYEELEALAINLGSQVADVKIWAINAAEEIKSEYERRSLLRKEDITNCEKKNALINREGNELTLGFDDKAAFHHRIKYWNYLRTGLLFFNYQINQVRVQLQKREKEIAEKDVKYAEEKQGTKQTSMYSAMLEKKMNDLVKRIWELRELTEGVKVYVNSEKEKEKKE